MTRINAEYRSPELDWTFRCVAVHIRALFLVFALLVAGASCAQADPQRFHAGIARITVQDVVPFDAVVVYPTGAGEVPFQDGQYTIAASRDAPIATEAPFPIVLFSHGGGGTIKAGGSPLLYAALLTSLAREGFFVVAPFHPGSKRPREALEDRPRQITRRSMQCWPIHASRRVPILTALA